MPRGSTGVHWLVEVDQDNSSEVLPLLVRPPNAKTRPVAGSDAMESSARGLGRLGRVCHAPVVLTE